MSEATELIVIPKGGALELFTTEGAMDVMLKAIEDEVKKHKPDLSTDKGRKAIASNAFKPRKCKARFDELGKDCIDEHNKIIDSVNSSRRSVREFLDKLSVEARKPLDEWQKAEDLRVAAEKLAAEVESDHTDAILEYKLFVLEAAEAARVAEAERGRIEEEQKAEAERVRLARIEEDKRIAAEATAEAERVAAKKIADAEKERKQAELDKIAAQQREKLAAEQAEKDKVEAAQKAEQERLDAIKRTNEEAEQRAKAVEQARVVKLAAEKAEAENKAANKAHQRNVNQEALKCFTEHGIDEMVAKGIIEIIAKGKIDNVSINY